MSKEIERIKRKMVNVIRERQAEICGEIKRKFEDGIYINFDREFKSLCECIEELEAIKNRLWGRLK